LSDQRIYQKVEQNYVVLKCENPEYSRHPK